MPDTRPSIWRRIADGLFYLWHDHSPPPKHIPKPEGLPRAGDTLVITHQTAKGEVKMQSVSLPEEFTVRDMLASLNLYVNPFRSSFTELCVSYDSVLVKDPDMHIHPSFDGQPHYLTIRRIADMTL